MQNKIQQLIEESERSLAPQFHRLEQIAYHNQKKVLQAFQNNRIALRHFAPTSGYGYGDEGRDTLGALFADIFGAEAGIVSPNILAGTHALTVGLFGLLCTGDTLFSIAGDPYDTLHEVIAGKGIGSICTSASSDKPEREDKVVNAVSKAIRVRVRLLRAERL